jgi:hypothetical protein
VGLLLQGCQLIALILAAALLSPSMPSQGKATWYGAGGDCHDGRPRTCTPYTKGERVRYCAVGSWRWGDAPYQVLVTSLVTGKSTICTVRDYCHACKKRTGGRIIDLSPTSFKALGHTLGRGVILVTVRILGGR